MHMLLFSKEGAVIIAIFSLAAWIIGHQSSHCLNITTGRVRPIPLVQNIMGLETFAGFAFLGWFAYEVGVLEALTLMAISWILRLFIVKIEHITGLTQRAWLISTLGVVIVPIALGGLVWLILAQNSS